MRSFRPTPEQERWRQIATRSKLARETPWLAVRLGGWRRVTTLTRCAFFVLGVFVAALMAAILELLHVPKFLIFAGFMAFATAEWLILRKRLFGAGIEEALELAGLVMIAVQVVDLTSGTSTDIRLSLILGTILLAAGLRLLNPLFTTLSVIAFSCAIDFAVPHHSVGATAENALAGAVCLSVAWIALYLNRIQFRRPSVDHMLTWLIVTMPLAAYLWIESGGRSGLTIEMLRAAPLVKLLPAMMLIIFGVTAFTVGVRRRSHAPIIAFMISIGCIAYELRYLTSLSIEMKLIGWGSLVLLLTIGLGRYLRTPRRGITSTQFEESKGSIDLLQLAGASALTPQTAQDQAAPFKGGGGGFAGGGASGKY